MQEAPIYILVSTDSFLTSRELSKLLAAFVDKSTSDFNFDRFSAKDHTISQILDACNLMPMMATNRVVLVRDIEGFKKEDAEALQSYFSNPSQSTKLILVGAKIDGRQKCWSVAKKNGWVHELKPPYLSELPAYIMGEAQKKGLKIPREASEILSETFGVDLGGLDLFLSKLLLFLGDKKEARFEDVVSLLSEGKSVSVFQFVDDFVTEKKGKILPDLDNLTVSGESPVMMVHMLARHYRILIQTREAIDSRISDFEIPAMLGVNPYFAKNYIAQARKSTKPRLQKTYKKILQTDRLLKRSPVSNALIMEKLVLES